LNSVANGDVLMPTGIKVYLSYVYLFYTGSKHVPISYDFSKYVLEFKLNDSRNRFSPSCKTRGGCGKLGIPIVERYEDMVKRLMPFVISFQVLLYGSWITEHVKKLNLKGEYAF
jgi:hypothetical protein